MALILRLLLRPSRSLGHGFDLEPRVFPLLQGIFSIGKADAGVNIRRRQCLIVVAKDETERSRCKTLTSALSCRILSSSHQEGFGKALEERHEIGAGVSTFLMPLLASRGLFGMHSATGRRGRSSKSTPFYPVGWLRGVVAPADKKSKRIPWGHSGLAEDSLT